MRYFNPATLITGMLFLLAGLVPAASAGNLTMTTYYPAPFGAYSQMRLVPEAAPAAACQPGTLYSQDTGLLRYCRDLGFGNGPEYTPLNVWTQGGPSGTSVYLSDLNHYNDLKVGIGTVGPDSTLQVEAANGPASLKVDQSGFSELTLTSGGDSSIMTKDTALRIGTSNTDRITITNDGKVGINNSAPAKTLVVNGDVQIIAATGKSSQITFTVGTTSVTVGVDQADNNFKISWGSELGGSDAEKGQITVIPSKPGQKRPIFQFNGPIYLQGTETGDPVAPLRVRYYDTGNPDTDGYYSTYAPTP